MIKKRYLGDYIVRWTDKDGTRKSKKYEDWHTAQKAYRWLGAAGITDVDIAVESKKLSIEEKQNEQG